MTILFLISSEGYYGAENMLVALARNLQQLGVRCIVGVFCDSRFQHTEVAEQARRQGLTVEIVPCRGRWDWKAVSAIRKVIINNNIDVVHSHGYKSDLYGYAAALPKRARLVATSHNWPSKRPVMRAYAGLDRLVLRRFDNVVVVSGAVSDILKRWGVKPERVSMICNGVDIERFQGANPALRTGTESKDCSLVGFVGRLVADKGGEILLRAAQQVLAVQPNTKFVFAGEGPSRRDWEALAQELGIWDHVLFIGARRDMPEVYASFDMVVLPSLIESMPMCVLEAMASGKPVVATRVGAVSQIIIPEQTGVLVNPNDVNALATAILRLRADASSACRLGENGRARAAKHFSAHSMAKEYISIYEQTVAARRNGKGRQPMWEVG